MNRIPRLSSSLFINTNSKFTCRCFMSRDENFFIHSHDFFEIFLTLDDNVVHLINETRITLPKGTLVFIRPDDRHTFEHSKEAFHIINLSVATDFIEVINEYLHDCFDFEALLNTALPPSVTLDEQKLNHLSRQLSNLYDVTSSNFIEKKLYAKVLLLKIFTENFGDYTNLYFDEDIPLWLSYTYEEMKKTENFAKGFKQMVKISGKSQEYLSRCFKQYYGITPTDYIISNRLNYVAGLLLNKNVNITDLIYASGFQNLSWFYSCFRKKYGVMPKDYIAAHIRENNPSDFDDYYEKK